MIQPHLPNQNFMKKLIIASVALCALVSSVCAEQTRKVQFRTLCLGQIEELGTVLLWTGMELPKAQEVVLYTDVSPVIEGVFNSNEAIFYTEKPGPDGKPLRVSVGQVTLGKAQRQLLLFLPSGGGEGKLPYQVRAYDDELSTFALGSVRAINLAPVPVRFILAGATTPQIPPVKYALFPHPAKVDAYNMYPVVIEFQSADGKWVKGQSVSWKANERRREIVVTLVDQRFRQPTVQTFSDFPPWAGGVRELSEIQE